MTRSNEQDRRIIHYYPEIILAWTSAVLFLCSFLLVELCLSVLTLKTCFAATIGILLLLAVVSVPSQRAVWGISVRLNRLVLLRILSRSLDIPIEPGNPQFRAPTSISFCIDGMTYEISVSESVWKELQSQLVVP